MSTLTPNQYLQAILEQHTISNRDDDNPTIQDLRDEREELETFLDEKFPTATFSVYYAGSYAKNTMLNPPSDLDIPVYLACDDTNVGDSLKAIYETFQTTLAERYFVEPHRSCLRLTGRKDGTLMPLTIDVVPGRYVYENPSENADCYLYQSTGEKSRLKTNIRKQMRHVRDSKLTDIIKLVKLWKKRNYLQVRTFAIELLVIKILGDTELNKQDYAACLKRFWETLRDKIDSLSIQDPGNAGNDLGELLNASVKESLKYAAINACNSAEYESTWPSIFGPLVSMDSAEKKARIERVFSASPASSHSKPWAWN